MTKKRVTFIIIATLVIPVFAFGYLAVVGMTERIEAKSNGNIVKFSNPAEAKGAARLSTNFRPFENVEVQMEAVSIAEGGLANDEVRLKIQMTGEHRRRLFDSKDYIVGTSAEMKDKIVDHLVRITGDKGLQIKRLELSSYLAE